MSMFERVVSALRPLRPSQGEMCESASLRITRLIAPLRNAIDHSRFRTPPTPGGVRRISGPSLGCLAAV
jgi:hypothetical protein